jgi:uncharacterized protein YraI
MQPRLRILAAAALACCLGHASPALAQGTASQGIVTADVVNVRDGAGTQHSVVGQLKKGDGVLILGQNGSWYQIRSQNGELTGFCQFRLIRPTGSDVAKSAPVQREIPRYQFSPSISIDDQYTLQKYADYVGEELRKKIKELSAGVEGEVTFDGAGFDDLGFAFWDTNEFQMFELIVPMTEESFLRPSSVTRVGSGYVFDDKNSALIKNMLQLVQEAYLAAESHLPANENTVFVTRRYAPLTEVTYVNRRGQQLAFLRPFDVSLRYFNQSFYVYLEDYEDSVNLNPDGETIQFTTEIGAKLIEFLKLPYPKGARLR